MQTFSVSTPGAGPVEGRKNYVFVDEHNRHKRLKVMRACAGCRKRKIKCDSATTNIWPCSACTRLKLICIPPTVGQDGDYPSHDQGQEVAHHSATVHTVPSSTPGVPRQTSHLYQHPSSCYPGSPYTLDSMRGYVHDLRPSHPQPYLEGSSHDHRRFYPHESSFQLALSTAADFQPNQQPLPPPSTTYAVPPSQTTSAPTNSDSYFGTEQSTVEDLSDILGDLKIDETGVAPYVRQQKTAERQPEVPSPDECEEFLPPLSTEHGSTIRIPPELMPSEDDAMAYFDIFFNHIHPYVPVVHRAHFYQQWRRDKSSISPLLLEAIFACAGRISDDPAQGAQWLAMANRHEPAFMDAPRLSTLQALLLLLKAREASPKKGYYYRSWRLVKIMVSMAKDLELDEHYAYHAEDKPCGFDPVECLVRTRVWQTLLVVEIMIGGPQGRSDLSVDPNTVEVRTMWNIPDLDDFETERCRQYAYFVRNALNIRLLTDAYHKAKKQKNWGVDPRFIGNNSLVDKWLPSLPPDLQVTYPEDGSPPWLPSHFVGNMHSHYHLTIIMLHRPQLVACKSFHAGGEWRTHMALCCASAKKLCRLQEAIYSSFGLSGLFYMQRGISFVLYSILTCTMLHLIAITSPDPEFHSDAREYFTRHMRLLEKCAPSWPVPEIQAQILTLRQAFSADINKPFELKPNFPYGSPSESYRPTPPMDPHYNPSSYLPNGQQNPGTFTTHPITPPTSAQASDKVDSPHQHGYGLVPTQSQHSNAAAAANAPVVDEHNWNPTRIINQWNLAFPSDGSLHSPPTAAALSSQANGAMLQTQNQMQYSAATKMMPISAQQPHLPQPYNPQQPSVISARDWQQSVASVYDPHGLKRRWDQTTHVVPEPSLPDMNR
ncbi:hypothetical protein VTO42DRAFT_6591 [Malbranchea cinnamomea]